MQSRILSNAKTLLTIDFLMFNLNIYFRAIYIWKLRGVMFIWGREHRRLNIIAKVMKDSEASFLIKKKEIFRKLNVLHFVNLFSPHFIMIYWNIWLSLFLVAVQKLDNSVDARLTLSSLLLEEDRDDEAISMLSPPIESGIYALA